MDCSSCGALIPDDSMFCTECGARQVQSKAQSFAGATQGQNIGGGQGNFGRSFGAVSPEAIRNERDAMNQQMGNLPPELLNQIASGIQSNQNMPPGQFPPQQFNQNQFNQPQNQFNQQQNQFNQQQNQFNQQQNQFNQNTQPQGMQNVGSNMKQSDMPNQIKGPSLVSGQGPSSSIKSTNPFTPGGTAVANNPSNSKTDAMVNQLAEQEREIKNERRSQWLNMNASPANEVLKSINSEIPAQFQGITQEANQAAQNLVGSLSGSGQDETLVRRICEVATRRVARKRGVAVETPQSSIQDKDLQVKITFIDDGRVLDSSEDLANAFKHAIHTELALKGMEFEISINLFSSKDGEVSLEIGSKGDTDEEEEMFACEICDGLVSENDNVCPHCGAVFEDEEEELVEEQKSSPPPSSRSGATWTVKRRTTRRTKEIRTTGTIKRWTSGRTKEIRTTGTIKRWTTRRTKEIRTTGTIERWTTWRTKEIRTARTIKRWTTWRTKEIWTARTIKRWTAGRTKEIRTARTIKRWTAGRTKEVGTTGT